MAAEYNDNIMFDVTGPELVEVHISMDGKIWVNCDGKRRFRAYLAKKIIVVDDRNRYNSERPKLRR